MENTDKYIDAVMYNPASFPKNDTGVANVMLIHGQYEADKEYDYCLVLDTYRNYTDYNIYTVILEDGTITQLKSKDDLNDSAFNGVNNMVYTYTTDSKGWTEFESVFNAKDGNANNNNAYYAVNENDGKTLDKGETTWVEDVATGYNVAFGKVYVPFAKWVQTFHVTYGNGTDWDKMLGDRNADVIWNAFDVDTDADTADTIAFEDGQQAVIVYDDKDRVKAAWVIADADDEIVIPDEPTGDVITKTTINGFTATSPASYTTIARAVENAAPLNLSAEQAKAVTLKFTRDAAWNGYARYNLYVNAADTEGAADSDIDQKASWDGQTGTITSAMNDGNVIVIRLTNSTTGEPRYVAYEVVVK